MLLSENLLSLKLLISKREFNSAFVLGRFGKVYCSQTREHVSHRKGNQRKRNISSEAIETLLCSFHQLRTSRFQHFKLRVWRAVRKLCKILNFSLFR
ncbi:hypothetical protein ACROYT_G006919 [Oculina patagonica]